MKKIERLVDRIARRVNINLREMKVDVTSHIPGALPLHQLVRFNAFYGITPHHPLSFRFSNASLAGSYFLGKCTVDHAILYKSDIRGDELKARDETFQHGDMDIPVYADEIIEIKDSILVKTLVHHNSHDPENLEVFMIHNTFAAPYANIHGSPSEGCLYEPFSTVDLTTVHDSVIGRYAYVQVGEMDHHHIDPGTIWVQQKDRFEFKYRFPETVLNRYITTEPGKAPRGIFMDFMAAREADFQQVFNVIDPVEPSTLPRGTAVNRYAVLKGDNHIGENVLIAQRAYVENSWLGDGANAQENCFIINSRLEGFNVTAHGGKIVHATLGEKTFVGFNAFLRGKPGSELTIGSGCIVMPHTIMDLTEPVSIPAEHLVWGHISQVEELETCCVPIGKLAEIEGDFFLGDMRFTGSGAEFTTGFKHRIEHILEANGAYFDGSQKEGHAQKDQHISFNTMQPYTRGNLAGLYPTIEIHP